MSHAPGAAGAADVSGSNAVPVDFGLADALTFTSPPLMATSRLGRLSVSLLAARLVVETRLQRCGAVLKLLGLLPETFRIVAVALLQLALEATRFAAHCRMCARPRAAAPISCIRARERPSNCAKPRGLGALGARAIRNFRFTLEETAPRNRPPSVRIVISPAVPLGVAVPRPGLRTIWVPMPLK